MEKTKNEYEYNAKTEIRNSKIFLRALFIH